MKGRARGGVETSLSIDEDCILNFSAVTKLLNARDGAALTALRDVLYCAVMSLTVSLVKERAMDLLQNFSRFLAIFFHAVRFDGVLRADGRHVSAEALCILYSDALVCGLTSEVTLLHASAADVVRAVEGFYEELSILSGRSDSIPSEYFTRCLFTYLCQRAYYCDWHFKSGAAVGIGKLIDRVPAPILLPRSLSLFKALFFILQKIPVVLSFDTPPSVAASLLTLVRKVFGRRDADAGGEGGTMDDVTSLWAEDLLTQNSEIIRLFLRELANTSSQVRTASQDLLNEVSRLLSVPVSSIVGRHKDYILRILLCMDEVAPPVLLPEGSSDFREILRTTSSLLSALEPSPTLNSAQINHVTTPSSVTPAGATSSYLTTSVPIVVSTASLTSASISSSLGDGSTQDSSSGNAPAKTPARSSMPPRVRFLPLLAQIGIFDAMSYLISLRPVVIEYDSHLLSLFDEATHIAESDTSALLATQQFRVQPLEQEIRVLREAILRLFTAVSACPALQGNDHQELRDKIIRVFLKVGCF